MVNSAQGPETIKPDNMNLIERAEYVVRDCKALHEHRKKHVIEQFKMDEGIDGCRFCLEMRTFDHEAHLTAGIEKMMVTFPVEMAKALEEERKARKLGTLPEVLRSILGEYFKLKAESD